MVREDYRLPTGDPGQWAGQGIGGRRDAVESGQSGATATLRMDRTQEDCRNSRVWMCRNEVGEGKGKTWHCKPDANSRLGASDCRSFSGLGGSPIPPIHGRSDRCGRSDLRDVRGQENDLWRLSRVIGSPGCGIENPANQSDATTNPARIRLDFGLSARQCHTTTSAAPIRSRA